MASECRVRHTPATLAEAIRYARSRWEGLTPVIASLVETCKLNGIDPQAYLADIITRIVNGHRNSRIDDLMPWAYRKSELADAVRSEGQVSIQGACAIRDQ